MEPKFFTTPAAWRAWLEKHHDQKRELLVGFYKKDSGKPSITWAESVDAALCFGWIDGVRRRIDNVSYSIRFTPRKPASNWSVINMRRVAELTAQSLMYPAGIKAFEARQGKNAPAFTPTNNRASRLMLLRKSNFAQMPPPGNFSNHSHPATGGLLADGC
jgi:uncharacterized protein YdeI (YjbR/CyaY-like superfamily)